MTARRIETGEGWESQEAVDSVPHFPELTAWRRAARRHQSNWREERGYPRGNLRPRDCSTRSLGSRLQLEFARKGGANFLTPQSCMAAVDRMAKTQRLETLDKDRLWSDLLSSMPLCFNLFGPAWADSRLAAAVGGRWFPSLC